MDAKDLTTNEKIYFKGHAKATYMSDGRNVEEAINEVAKVYDASVKFIEVDRQAFDNLRDRYVSIEEFENVFGDTFRNIDPNSVYYLKRREGSSYETLILLSISDNIYNTEFVFGYNFANSNTDLAMGVQIIFIKEASNYFITTMEV